jgi:hypothetical protein
MKPSVRHLLFWSPRVLGLLFAGFLGVFALDVFNEGYGFWSTILALLIHLIPAEIVVVAILVSWRWDWVGAALLATGGAYYALTNLRHPDWILLISGPAFLISLLLFMNWVFRKELRATS